MCRSLRRGDIKAYERRLGALRRKGIKIEGSEGKILPSAFGDGMGLFFGPSLFEITKTMLRFEELGLADLLDSPPEPQSEESKKLTWLWNLAQIETDSSARICEALGANAPSIEIFGEEDPQVWREFSEREEEAWFFTLFASFYRRQTASYADMDERLSWAHALGRLLEWRRWRREGYDLAAVQQADFVAGRKKGEGPRMAQEKKKRRQRLIAEIVNRLGEPPRKKSGRVHWGYWANAVRKEATIQAVLARKKAITLAQHKRADLLNEIAGQTGGTIISQIRAAMEEGEIRKVD